jgi:cyanophycin synthetase
MKILKIQTLRGANIWSSYRKNVIQMRLDLEDMEKRPTNLIEGFKERLVRAMPTLAEHECSEGVYGGFLSRVEEGTWMGHVIEHIALEMQTLAGMETGYGRTRSTKDKGIYNVVFSYADTEAGHYAAEASVRFAQAIIDARAYNIEEDIEALRKIFRRNALGPSTASIVHEAERRGIPWLRLGKNSAIQLGYGANQARFQATMTYKTSALAVETACDKEKTKSALEAAGIPVPAGYICEELEEVYGAAEKLGFPLVVKPVDANQGKGATINITGSGELQQAFGFASAYSSEVMVERYISGYDFRMLVIDNKFVAAARRLPAMVTGDGRHTIKQLIDILNEDARRGEGHGSELTKVAIDTDTQCLLSKHGYSQDTVPAAGETVTLKSTANLSTGGTSADVTAKVHPENIKLAEQVAKIIGLDICGIDIMTTTLQTPLRQNGGAVIEVNAAPGFRMHLAPSEGQPRNVAAPVLDMLFPNGKPSRIPLVAVTGTNGKTTTTRLIAHIAATAGRCTGFTTTDGSYVDNVLHRKGDNTGPQSAHYILTHPCVEFAVLETARGGILRAGLGFDQCDVGIITNIQEDHLGLNDINTLDDLAKVKSVVVQNVKPDGWAILNADDAQCRKIAPGLGCNVAWFSLEKNAEQLANDHGGDASFAFCEEGCLIISTAGVNTRICKVDEIPLTYQGKAAFMVANVLAASLAAYLSGFGKEVIAAALAGFAPGIDTTPGRMNVFEFNDFKVLVDYAHNPHGYCAIETYLQNVSARRKIGIISGVGDRRDADIRECGLISARMFDHIIIRNEHDLRGRTEEEITSILAEGIREVSKEVTFEVVPDECDAVRHAIAIAKHGDYIVALTDQIDDVAKTLTAMISVENLEHSKVTQSA